MNGHDGGLIYDGWLRHIGWQGLHLWQGLDNADLRVGLCPTSPPVGVWLVGSGGVIGPVLAEVCCCPAVGLGGETLPGQGLGRDWDKLVSSEGVVGGVFLSIILPVGHIELAV